MSNIQKSKNKKLIIALGLAIVVACKIYNASYERHQKPTSIVRSDYGDYLYNLNKR